MKLYPKRKTDEEFVEGIRKCLHNRWQRVVRVGNAGAGVVMVGLGIWIIFRSSALLSGSAFSGPEHEFVRMGMYIGIVMGIVAGLIIISGVTIVMSTFLWQGTAQTQRLMLKYHDALVAHGISPDEQDE